LAICSGVTVTYPWPIAIDSVSPAYHGSPKRWRFQALLG